MMESLLLLPETQGRVLLVVDCECPPSQCQFHIGIVGLTLQANLHARTGSVSANAPGALISSSFILARRFNKSPELLSVHSTGRKKRSDPSITSLW